MNGFNHFAQLNMMAGYAKSKGVPAPALAVSLKAISVANPLQANKAPMLFRLVL